LQAGSLGAPTTIAQSTRKMSNEKNSADMLRPEIWALEEQYKALPDGPNSKRRAKMKAELQQMKMEFGGYESVAATQQCLLGGLVTVTQNRPQQEKSNDDD